MILISSLRGAIFATKFATNHRRIRPDESADLFGGQSPGLEIASLPSVARNDGKRGTL